MLLFLVLSSLIKKDLHLSISHSVMGNLRWTKQKDAICNAEKMEHFSSLLTQELSISISSSRA